MTSARPVMVANCRGVALLTALLVVALVTVAAVAMVDRQQLDIHRTGNIMEADRAWQVALGVEAWAIGQLERDTNQVDHLDEDWAKPLPATQVEGGGTVSGEIIDLQGRYNLNNLVNANVPDQPEQPPPQGNDGQDQPERPGAQDTPPINLNKQRMSNLLQALDLDERLVGAVIDWVDEDGNPQGSGGAEDGVYSLRTPAYRAANAPMVSVTELRLVDGFEADAYAALQAQVAALPEETPINVNTAEPALLRAIAPKLSALDADSIVQDRLKAPFDSVQAFTSFGPLRDQQVNSKGLAVRSRYFQVVGIASVGRTRVRLTSVLHREEDNKVRVLYRSRGDF